MRDANEHGLPGSGQDGDATRIAAELLGTLPSHDPFASAVRATRMPMVVTNPRLPDNPIAFVNDSFCRLTGYARDEIVGRNCRFLQGPLTRAEDVTAIRQAISEERSIEVDIRNYRKDGTAFWNRLLLAPVHDEAGDLTYFFASQLDVTMERERLAGLEAANAVLAAERVSAEQRLAVSEATLKLAVDAGEIGTWDLDLTTNLLTWPPRTKAMFGISPETSCTMDDFYAGLHPDDLDATSRAFETALDPKVRASYDVEYRTIGKEDGHLRWVAAKGRAFFDAEGRCVRAMGTAIDITRRKATEERLRASEAQYRTLFDTIDEGFCVVQFIDGPQGPASDYLHLEANPAYVRHAGIPDIVGKTGRAALTEAEAEGWVELFRQVLETGEPIRFERELEVTSRILEVACFVIDPDRKHLAILFTDITARKRAEQRLLELKDTLELQVAERTQALRLHERIIQSDSTPICAFDTDYRLIAFNQAHNDEFFRVNGFYTKLGDVFWKLFVPEQRPVMKALMSRVLAGETFTVEEAFGNPTIDAPRWEIHYTPIRDDSGRVTGGFHHARDISGRLRAQAELSAAQEQLRQSQKMEAMGSLTGGVAHDFNNLLTPIIGSLDMLVRKNIGGEREQRLIDGALQSAERAKTLVQRLLAFARRQPLQPTAVDLARLIDGLTALIESTLGPTIALRVDVAPELPNAHGDTNQLEMALLNLAVNARDAMPEGGSLMITVTCETLETSSPEGLKAGEYVRLRVSDSGSGMDEATRERAIEPFFSTKGVGKGTGLGLSMVHGLANQLGGGLTLESAPGQGTKVSLWLPTSAAVAHAGDVGPEPPAVRMKLGLALLVDDEELVRMSTSDMLHDLGYDVLEAASADEALQLVREGVEPNILVTDHLMPGMNGVQLARVLKAERPKLPVLIVSGYAESEGIDAELPRLTKPFRHAELAAALSTVIASDDR